ncbi:related to endochitinase class V precursor [Ramularia collo-cygni]|uniref:chitinase n=1 Tax=Ramularia collo-cygni TaxID=112498 RepID=A0A2D3UXJ2_9PEZI|nr:related to endochitinase class V precursor [Ramularia collo-cygni]CZT20148.1 related to endochitinase class V precursor [Ramularia collo-cygni]
MWSSSLLTSLLLSTTTLVSAINAPAHQAHLNLHHNKREAYVPPPVIQSPLHKGYKAVAYYVNWAIYARNHPPQEIPSQSLTHILYAFGGINNKTGEAYLTDPYADIEKTWPGDVPSNSTSLSKNGTQVKDMDMFGNLKQLYLHKKKNRGLKTLLSIGGWGLRTYFAPALESEEGRRRFAVSSVGLLKDLGFDGLDIDWEYPSSPKESQDLVETCRLIRQELDSYALTLTSTPSYSYSYSPQPPPHFLLTLSVPAGPINYKHFNIPALSPYIDFINLMGYDYQGAAFSNFSGHAQNVYKSTLNPRSTDFNTEDPVEYYLGEGGLQPERLVLGMPLYGRSFANTTGPGEVFGNTTDGSWEAGIWDYKALPLNNSQIYHDNDLIASWSYNNQTKYMVSYDTPEIAIAKTKYLVKKGLGGAMWWETSGDFPITDERSLIRTVRGELETCGGLEGSLNVLEFPGSKYRNLREGMPGQ